MSGERQPTVPASPSTRVAGGGCVAAEGIKVQENP